MNQSVNQTVVVLLALFASVQTISPVVARQDQPAPQKPAIDETEFLSPARTWTANGGKHTVIARLINLDDKMAVLKRTDNGRIARVPLAILSETDIAFLKQLEEQKRAEVAQILPAIVAENAEVVPGQHELESAIAPDDPPLMIEESHPNRLADPDPKVDAPAPLNTAPEPVVPDNFSLDLPANETTSPDTLPPVAVDATNSKPDTSNPLLAMTDQEIVARIRPTISLGLDPQMRIGDDMETLTQNPDLEFRLDGNVLGSAWRVGFMDLDFMIDQDGKTLSVMRLPPNEPNVNDGWVFLDSGARVFHVPISPPINTLQAINRVHGRMKIAFVTDLLTIQLLPDATTAELLAHPLLAQSGIKVSIRKLDTVTLIAEVSGLVSDIVDVSVVCLDSIEVEKSQSISKHSAWYQFKFTQGIPAKAAIQIQIARASREVTLPFDFLNVQTSK